MASEKKERIKALGTEITKINVKLENEDELLNILQKSIST